MQTTLTLDRKSSKLLLGYVRIELNIEKEHKFIAPHKTENLSAESNNQIVRLRKLSNNFFPH